MNNLPESLVDDLLRSVSAKPKAPHTNDASRVVQAVAFADSFRHRKVRFASPRARNLRVRRKNR
jgi:hypothetical protein